MSCRCVFFHIFSHFDRKTTSSSFDCRPFKASVAPGKKWAAVGKSHTWSITEEGFCCDCVSECSNRRPSGAAGLFLWFVCSLADKSGIQLWFCWDRNPDADRGRWDSNCRRLKSEFMTAETQTRRCLQSKDVSFSSFCFIHFFNSPNVFLLWPFDPLILLFCCAASSSSLSSFIHFFRLSFLKLHLCVRRSLAPNFLSSPPFSVSDQSTVLEF